jgi:hypothetical protein
MHTSRGFEKGLRPAHEDYKQRYVYTCVHTYLCICIHQEKGCAPQEPTSVYEKSNRHAYVGKFVCTCVYIDSENKGRGSRTHQGEKKIRISRMMRGILHVHIQTSEHTHTCIHAYP